MRECSGVKNGIDYRFLKITALVSMTADHIGAVLFPEVDAFRIIGRISFPIFLFMLVNSYRYTSDRAAFYKRLLIFSYVSVIPYYLAFHKVLDIGFTLLSVVITIGGLDVIEAGYRMKERVDIRGLILAIMPVLYSIAFRTDYGWFAIGMGILIYYREVIGIYPLKP